MAVLELTLVPIGTKETSVSKYVATAYKAIENMDNINVELNPMGTVLEGDIDDLFLAVRKMQEAVFSEGADRVYSVIKIDDRRDENHSMSYKVESVKEKLI